MGKLNINRTKDQQSHVCFLHTEIKFSSKVYSYIIKPKASDFLFFLKKQTFY